MDKSLVMPLPALSMQMVVTMPSYSLMYLLAAAGVLVVHVSLVSQVLCFHRHQVIICSGNSDQLRHLCLLAALLFDPGTSFGSPVSLWPPMAKSLVIASPAKNTDESILFVHIHFMVNVPGVSVSLVSHMQWLHGYCVALVPCSQHRFSNSSDWCIRVAQ